MSSQSNDSVLNGNNNSNNSNNMDIDSDSQENIDDQENSSSALNRRRIKKVGKRTKKGSKGNNRKLKYPSKLHIYNHRQIRPRPTNGRIHILFKKRKRTLPIYALLPLTRPLPPSRGANRISHRR